MSLILGYVFRIYVFIQINFLQIIILKRCHSHVGISPIYFQVEICLLSIRLGKIHVIVFLSHHWIRNCKNIYK
nr:hypothetical protein [uncultured bacterium]